MSVLIEKEFTCTHCQFPNLVGVWSIVNVKEDPELKDLLLGGELNMAECTSCKEIFYAEGFVLYHDSENEILAFVYPYEARKQREEYETKTQRDFENLQASQANAFPYGPLTFFGLDELVRLIEDEDEKTIQGEIVAVLSSEMKIPVASLRPSVARRQSIPRVVPGFSKSDPFHRDRFLNILSIIEQANSNLGVYANWRKRVSENPTYEIRFE